MIYADTLYTRKCTEVHLKYIYIEKGLIISLVCQLFLWIVTSPSHFYDLIYMVSITPWSGLARQPYVHTIVRGYFKWAPAPPRFPEMAANLLYCSPSSSLRTTHTSAILGEYDLWPIPIPPITSPTGIKAMCEPSSSFVMVSGQRTMIIQPKHVSTKAWTHATAEVTLHALVTHSNIERTLAPNRINLILVVDNCITRF